MLVCSLVLCVNWLPFFYSQERLQRKNYLRVFSGVIQTSDRRRDFIVKTEDYVDDILTDSQQCIGTPAKEVLSEFAQFIRRYPKSSVSLETLLKYVKSPDAVKVLTEREWVEVNTGGSQVTFAIPRVARFVEMCVEGGEEIKRLVERKSTSFSRLPLSEALEYKMRFSILGPAFHIADLCGKGVVVK